MSTEDQKTIRGYAVTGTHLTLLSSQNKLMESMFLLIDSKKWSEFKLIDFPSKKWDESDVEIAITHCGCFTFFFEQSRADCNIIIP